MARALRCTGFFSFTMSKAIFIFISSLLLLLPVVLSEGGITASNQMALCLPFILFIGIPHGAIDNLLYLREKKLNNTQFIAIYLTVVFANVLLWMLMPICAYLVFLIISAYHFGQSQFAHYFKETGALQRLLAISWGVSILSALIYFNIEEIQNIMLADEHFLVFDLLHQAQHMHYLFLVSSMITLSIMVLLTIKKAIKKEMFLLEMVVFFLILVSFEVMPFLIGFTLYFVILHSMKVLNEEYNFLSSKKEVRSWKGFISLLAPLTLFSFAGIALIFLLIYLELIPYSYGYCLLIIISSITLPHVFVMNRFYQLFKP